MGFHCVAGHSVYSAKDWSNKKLFSVWSGALATAGGIACDGTLEGYLKRADQKNGKVLFQNTTLSGNHRRRLYL